MKLNHCMTSGLNSHSWFSKTHNRAIKSVLVHTTVTYTGVSVCLQKKPHYQSPAHKSFGWTVLDERTQCTRTNQKRGRVSMTPHFQEWLAIHSPPHKPSFALPAVVSLLTKEGQQQTIASHYHDDFVLVVTAHPETSTIVCLHQH